MKFEYNPKKSATNKTKHGITLEQAQQLWFVPSIEIEARTQDEPRYMIIGKLKGKFYFCVFTKGTQMIRLISARCSRKTEEKIYREYIKT